MYTEPTSITPGCAGTPLSHHATELRHNATNEPTSASPNSDAAISDTLETTDREPDGRQPIARRDSRADNDRTDHGSLLDLSG